MEKMRRFAAMMTVRSLPLIEDARYSSMGPVVTLETADNLQNTHYALGVSVVKRYFELMDRIETNNHRGLPQVPVGLPEIDPDYSFVRLDIPDQFGITYYSDGTLLFDSNNNANNEPLMKTGSAVDLFSVGMEPQSQSFFPSIDRKIESRLFTALQYTDAYYRNFNKAVDLVRFYRKKKLAVPDHIFPAFPHEAIRNLRGVPSQTA